MILTALAKDPAARYQKMEDLEAALVAAAPGVDVGAPISRASPNASTSADAPAVQSGGHSPVPPVRPTQVAPKKRRWAMAAGFLATLFAFVAVAVYLVSPAAPIASPPAPSPSPPPPAAPAPAPAAESPPSRAALTVDSDPPGADVALDDIALGKTPLVAPVTIDGQEHTLRLELAGFRPESRQIVLDRDRAVAVALKKRARERERQHPAPMDIKEGR